MLFNISKNNLSSLISDPRCRRERPLSPRPVTGSQEERNRWGITQCSRADLSRGRVTKEQERHELGCEQTGGRGHQSHHLTGGITFFSFFFFPREKNKAGLQYRARVQRTIKSLSASHIRDKVNRPDKVVAATRWWAQTILVQISQPHDSSLLFSTGAWKALCLVQRLCRWEEWN